MDIKYCIRQLEFEFNTNRFKRKNAETLLLKINDQFYLNYHPWIEFGDQSVGEFLVELKKTKTLPRFMKENLELEKDCKQIENRPFLNHNFGSSLYNLPFRKIKFMGCKKSLLNEIEASKEKLRIDLNLGLERREFLDFWSALDFNLKNKIDYFEDPCEILDEISDFEGIPIASDRFIYPETIEKVRIFKPSIEVRTKTENIIVSSYMGHDLGVYHTYLNLMRYGDLSMYHGIVTPPVYTESNVLFNFSNGYFELDEDRILDIYAKLETEEWKSI